MRPAYLTAAVILACVAGILLSLMHRATEPAAAGWFGIFTGITGGYASLLFADAFHKEEL